jgi:dihydrodipicolinate synthase/N-acetylneuraminate lyase
LIFEEGNPVGIKALLEMIEGVEVMSGVRLPLVSATESLQLKLKKFVDTY